MGGWEVYPAAGSGTQHELHNHHAGNILGISKHSSPKTINATNKATKHERAFKIKLAEVVRKMKHPLQHY